MRATERLYLTWDRKRVVPESNPNGRYPFCKPGDEISEEDVQKYGLQQGKSVPFEGKQRETTLSAAQPSALAQPAKGPRASEPKKAAAGQGKPLTPGQDLDTRSDDQLLEIAEKLEVELPEGGREALIVAILKKAGYGKEAEEREKKAAAVAENKMAGTPPNKGGATFPPESRRR